MAKKPPKGGKGGGPLKGLSSIVGKEKLKLAQQIAANPEAMAYYSKPGEMEKYYNTADSTLKDNAQIAAEQQATFDRVRQQAAQIGQSGQNLSQAFTSALGSATGSIAGLAGGNAAAMLDLMQTGQGQAATAGQYGMGISNLAGAELLQADIQQASYEAQAKAARDAMYQDMKQKALAAKEERLKTKMGLKSTEKSNILTALSSLFTLDKAAGGSGGGGKGGKGSGSGGAGNGGGGSASDILAANAAMAVSGKGAHAGLRGSSSSSTTSPSYSTYVRGPGDSADQLSRVTGGSRAGSSSASRNTSNRNSNRGEVNWGGLWNYIKGGSKSSDAGNIFY